MPTLKLTKSVIDDLEAAGDRSGLLGQDPSRVRAEGDAGRSQGVHRHVPDDR